MFDKRNVKNLYALTPLQEGILFHSLMDEGGSTYFEQACFNIKGHFDPSLFERAWNELIRRHDALRTIFVMKNVPQPLQIVLKKRELVLGIEDISHLDPCAQEEYVEGFRRKDRATPFDLTKDMLIRINVLKRGPQFHTLVWSFHHIVMDGWSVSVLYEELAVISACLSRGEPLNLPAPVQFNAYIRWLKGRDARAAGDFWKQYLTGYDKAVGLPRMESSDDSRVFTTERLKFSMDSIRSRGLTNLALECHVTINTVFQALWGVVLGACNRSQDVVFGMTVSGRPAEIKGIERMVGLFINAVPVRVKFNPDQTFRELLADLHSRAGAAQEFHYSSLADIQSATPLKQNLFDQLLVFENYPDPSDALGESGMGISLSDFDQFEQTNYDLTVEVFPGEALEYDILFNPHAFDEDIVRAVGVHLERVVDGVLESPDIQVHEIKVLTPGEEPLYELSGRQGDGQRDSGEQVTGRRTTTKFAPPETPTEEKLSEIWQEVLERPSVGIDDNFFEVGGHSLRATRIISRIHKAMGAEISLQEFFRHPDIRSLARLMDHKMVHKMDHKADGQGDPGTPQLDHSIPPCPASQDDYELSHAQRRLWILDRMEDDFTAYNQCAGFIFEGPLNRDSFHRALEIVARRHESLRTVFVERDGGPRQKIIPLEEFTLPLSHVDLRGSQDPQGAAQSIASKLPHEPLDLTKGPLWTATLLELAPHRHVVLLNMHHIICDGWSLVIFENEVMGAYGMLERGMEPEQGMQVENEVGRNKGMPAENGVGRNKGMPAENGVGRNKGMPAENGVGRNKGMEPLQIQYKDFAAWQNRRLNSPEMEAHARYWHERLQGEIPILNLPTDLPRPLARTYNGAVVHRSIPRETLERLQAFCMDNRISLFAAISALVKVLLFRYTGQRDIITGSPVAGRDHADLEDQIGFFVNTLALRDDIDPEKGFLSLVKGVAHTLTTAFDHQIYPFDRLVEELNVLRDVGRSPIFDVMVVLQNNIQVTADIPGLTISEYRFDLDQSQFDLTLIFSEGDLGLTLDVNYNTDLFFKETMERLTGHFITLLESALKGPDTPVAMLHMLTPGEYHAMTRGFNTRTREFPRDKTLARLFKEQAARTPNEPAVIYHDKTLSYVELDRASDILAGCLASRGETGPDVPVGVLLSRGHNVPVALLATLKAGCAFLPLDPETPESRLQYILSDSKTRIVITEEQHMERARQLNPGHIIDIRDAAMEEAIPDETGNFVDGSGGETNQEPWETIGKTSEIILKQSENRPKQTETNGEAGPENLAYIIYTSGSTGLPKGVMVEHRGFVNMILDQIDGFGVLPGDRVLQFATMMFDASMSEIFMALLSGAAVVMVDRDQIEDTARFLEYMEEKAVTVVTLPPVYLKMLNRHPMPHLRVLITAGEPAIKEDALFYSRTKHYFNAYGPTETSVCTSFHRVDPRGIYGDTIPVGAPVANNGVFILDSRLNPVPLGVPGEICFAGVGVARGYLNRPELTGEKFIANPFSPGERLYRIGDMGRWLPSGDMEFLGRMDEQIKIRGIRMEPGEIAAAIKSFPGVDDALVTVFKEGSPGENQLAAYVVSRSNPSHSRIRAHLSRHLPAHMIPNIFITLDRFPLTINGKIDRRALPDPAEVMKNQREERGETVPPATPMEKKIHGVWQTLFGAREGDIGCRDDFFTLGGDSIKAIRMVSLLREQGILLKVKDIFQWPTISELAMNGAARESSRGQGRDSGPSTLEPYTGPVAMTPIYRWFFYHFKDQAHHFNHSDLFHSPSGIDPRALMAASRAVMAHHDMLRLGCRYSEGNLPGYIKGNLPGYSEGNLPGCSKGNLPGYSKGNLPGHDYKGQGEVALEILPENDPCFAAGNLVNIEDLREEPLSRATQTLTHIASRAQSSFDLTRPPLIKIILFRLSDGDRLFIVMHHLLGDAVSWRIIMEDLQSAYEQHLEGKPIKLPPRSHPFAVWASAMEDYASGDELQREKSYWMEMISHPCGRLPASGAPAIDLRASATSEDGETTSPADEKTASLTDGKAASLTDGETASLPDGETASLPDGETGSLPDGETASMADMDHITMEWDEDKTRAFTAAARELRTGQDRLLLAALARVLRHHHGEPATLISLESHGRADMVAGRPEADDIDISRTVGWFTSQFPMVIQALDDETDHTGAIGAINQQLDRLPNMGIGWGLLKYLCQADEGNTSRTSATDSRASATNLRTSATNLRTSATNSRALATESRAPVTASDKQAPGEKFDSIINHPDPDINFNYLGEFEAYGEGLFQPANEDTGPRVSHMAPVIHDLDINGVIAHNRLNVIWHFNTKCFSKTMIRKMAEDFSTYLKSIVLKTGTM
ncbi:MAG: amino acid adenylation domain-containing protein [Desulfamplus sp.]|nr:amino acid adenylation domain-containing protein [Desulfamplus sp.]